ncbi:MAG: substrate-binding domain-containing protein [Planctomycetota bacterium]|jgi:LacI family transcriptional regulator|nr:substrate-binding domain-containing protein [Planctomycetota bacterium]
MRTTSHSANRAIAIALNLDDAYDQGVARGIARYAREAGGWDLHGYGWMFRPLKQASQHLAGAIARVTGRADARRISALGVPTVDVAGAVRDVGFYTVCNDDERTGHIAGQHFAKAGFSQAAFCGVSSVAWSAARCAGFVAGFGAPVRRRFLRPLSAWRSGACSDELSAWLNALPKPCALFASHDVAALRASQACANIVIAVPEAVAILGVDNEDLACELAHPSLSSIPIDTEALGYRAAASLDAILNRQPTPRRQLLPPRAPVLRASSAITLRSADAIVERALELINARACAGMNVAELVREFSLSRRSFEQRFKRATGTSPHRMLTQARLRQAEQLLHGTQLSMAAIAQRCGYGDPRSLHVAALRVWGCAPSALRARS